MRLIGRNVEQVLERFEEYADDTSGGYDDWREEDLYNHGDY